MCSVPVPHTFDLFSFFICWTVSLPYLFPISSVLFCSCFVSIPLESVLRTWFPRTVLKERFQGNSNTQLKQLPFARIQTLNCWYNSELHCWKCWHNLDLICWMNCLGLPYCSCNSSAVTFAGTNSNELITSINLVPPRLATCAYRLCSSGYNALVNYAGHPVRPRFDMSREQLEYFLCYDLGVQDIANAPSVSKSTVQQRFLEYGISVREFGYVTANKWLTGWLSEAD